MTKTMTKFYLDDEHAQLPTRGHPADAGLDLYAICDDEIPVGGQKLIDTGVIAAIPYGWCGQIWPRSGMALDKKADRRAGLIDAGYRKRIGVLLRNEGQMPLGIQRGQRIAQLVIVRVLMIPPVQVDSLADLGTSERGDGYGSSGE